MKKAQSIIKGNDSIKRSLGIIAHTMGMKPDDYAVKNRSQDYVHLRMIAELYLRQNHNDIRLCDMASFFGYNDHSTVVNLHASALSKLKRNRDFREKYNRAISAVTNIVNNNVFC